MSRSWFAAVLLMPWVAGLIHPVAASAQEPPTLAGRWTLNRELSQFPREAGFNADWLAHSGSSGDSTDTPPSQGGAPSGGNRTSFPVSRVSREDSMRNALLTTEAREPAAILVITETATEVTMTPDKGVVRTFHPTGREEVVQPGDPTITATSTREAGRLVVRYKVNQAHELRYTYSRVASPPQLVVDVQFLDRGKGEIIKRVYEPEKPAAAPAAAAPGLAAAPAPAGAAAPASRQEGMPASGSRGTQDYDRQPDAPFKGLSALGVVVEGLGAQATACGLRQEAIESAMVKQLSGAGLKVALNADEDTYLYVSVMTATLGNGMCLSRYDATLYTHTTAGLTYHPAPVLVDVSLLHKGSLAAGASAAHAESVMRGLQEYVGQFTTRIRDANR
jgi:hypothetical protein